MGMECDDGNVLNGDGCSDQCFIEKGYQCSFEKGEVSVCKFTDEVEISKMVITKS